MVEHIEILLQFKAFWVTSSNKWYTCGNQVVLGYRIPWHIAKLRWKPTPNGSHVFLKGSKNDSRNVLRLFEGSFLDDVKLRFKNLRLIVVTNYPSYISFYVIMIGFFKDLINQTTSDAISTFDMLKRTIWLMPILKHPTNNGRYWRSVNLEILIKFFLQLNCQIPSVQTPVRFRNFFCFL